MKRERYACGEKEEEPTRIKNFYKIIFKVFKLDEFRERHSGKLSEYLTWMMFGLIILILVFIGFSYA